jgi:hypothetical protein
VLFLIVAYLLIVVALPLLLTAAISFRNLPRGRGCPLCRNETFLLQHRPLALLRRVAPGTRLEHRWCACCAWEGVSRDVPGGAVPLPVEPPQEPRQVPSAGQAARPGTVEASRPVAERIDLKVLEVEGQFWRVLLESWAEGAGWRGRLLFMGPAGQVLTDPGHAFRGATRSQVLGQARGLSDPVLVSRVREVSSR